MPRELTLAISTTGLADLILINKRNNGFIMVPGLKKLYYIIIIHVKYVWFIMMNIINHDDLVLLATSKIICKTEDILQL